MVIVGAGSAGPNAAPVLGRCRRQVRRIVGAAEGCKAAYGVNRSLTREDFVQRASGERPIEHPPVVEHSEAPADEPADAPPNTRTGAPVAPATRTAA